MRDNVTNIYLDCNAGPGRAARKIGLSLSLSLSLSRQGRLVKGMLAEVEEVWALCGEEYTTNKSFCGNM